MKKLGLILQEMITTNLGTISSKIIIGAISYILLTIALIVLMFVNPNFPGVTDLLTVLVITSASLLGLTTIENIKNPMKNGKIEDQVMYRGSDRDFLGGEAGGNQNL